MTLLETIKLDNHDILVYDVIDTNKVVFNNISVTLGVNPTSYCPRLSCGNVSRNSDLTCCQFHNSYETYGMSCVDAVFTLVRDKLLSTNPEYFL